ncbi:MAG: chorismate mutase [Anaerolineae bacterium]|nr:chorismate mutase [Anaerolineae bacterium]
MSGVMRVRGVRGATTASDNTPEAISECVMELMTELLRVNAIDQEDIASVFFTSTPDLNAAFPAIGARRVGFANVPLLGMIEVDVPNAPKRCIRVLIQWNTEKRLDDIVHVYLRGATVLRPDFVSKHAEKADS